MSTKTEIANITLSHLGVGKEIANLETENSQEANTCRRFYDVAREATLRDFPWPFARKEVALGLVEENPTTEWSYSYRYPSDAVKLRRIFSGIRNDSRQTRVPFKIVRDATGRLVYCDLAEVFMEYIYNESDASRFTADFVLAFSLRLAVYAAPRLTSGDPFKLRDSLFKLYILEITKAQATAVNEQQDEENPDLDQVANSATEDPDKQGVIRTVKNAHLVYKRQSGEGGFDSAIMYTSGQLIVLCCWGCIFFCGLGNQVFNLLQSHNRLTNSYVDLLELLGVKLAFTLSFSTGRLLPNC